MSYRKYLHRSGHAYLEPNSISYFRITIQHRTNSEQAVLELNLQENLPALANHQRQHQQALVFHPSYQQCQRLLRYLTPNTFDTLPKLFDCVQFPQLITCSTVQVIFEGLSTSSRAFSARSRAFHFVFACTQYYPERFEKLIPSIRLLAVVVQLRFELESSFAATKVPEILVMECPDLAIELRRFENSSENFLGKVWVKLQVIDLAIKVSYSMAVIAFEVNFVRAAAIGWQNSIRALKLVKGLHKLN